ncbi:MAG: amidohydrolase family protein, partial [Ruthenibacterium sp.]
MQTGILARRIAVAQGLTPADLVFKNATIVNVFTQELIVADIAVADGVIAGLGNYSGTIETDCTGKMICPGFIDAHMHMESTMVAPAELARAIVPTGTTTLIADPHELVNVCGAEGVRYFLEATEGLPLN